MGALAIIIESAALQSCVPPRLLSKLPPADRISLSPPQELESHLLRDLSSGEQHPVHHLRPMGADMRHLAHPHQPARRAWLGTESAPIRVVGRAAIKHLLAGALVRVVHRPELRDAPARGQRNTRCKQGRRFQHEGGLL